MTGLAVTGVLALLLAGCSGGTPEGEGTSGGTTSESGGSGEVVELTFLTGTVEANVQTAQALADAFNAANPDVKVTVDASMPSGSEGDNLLKTRLATGDVPDLFWYNSGSLLQALNPDENLLDIGDEPWLDAVEPSFVSTVSTESGVYGVPAGSATGGGVLYWIPTFDELGLEVPTTWDEFIANNDALKAAGKVPVVQSYADTWTAQFFILADFFNVWAADNDWAEKYTNNQVKYATDPAALKGFQHIQQIYEGGYLNEDFASTTYDEALNKLGSGEGTQYPMATFALDTVFDLYPDTRDKIGFFALPGDGPNGLTVWMPSAVYAPADTKYPEQVKRFMAFVASPQGCDAMTEAVEPPGPYLVDGCSIPDTVPQAVSDMLPYFDDPELTVPALEFLSPIKGPSLEQICVEVGSGIRPAEDAAALYDEDVKKQAQQLGLDGW